MIREMEDHIDKRDAEARVTIDENVMNFGDYYGYENLPDDDDATLNHLFGLLECNGFSITDSRGITMVGVGVYPSISLLNHSMDPNCVAISIGKAVHLRALKDIQPGEELYINYCEELTPVNEIIDYCKNSYYFDYDLKTESEACQKWISDQDDKLVGKQSYHEEDPAEKSKKYKPLKKAP